jgi:hypothetical protein
LYYGVLSFSRGLILFRDPRKKEESLAGKHGLEAIDWRGVLANGILRVLDLRVGMTSGTFHELAVATQE